MRASRNRKVALGNLYLDPNNNYRFIDQSDYVFVPEDAIADPDIQRRTTAFLLGKNAEEVSDLVASFKKNGWLAVDQIQVRELSRGKYVVVEGDRRVATLKYLERRYQDSAIDLGNLDSKVFDEIPVVLYESANDAHHKVITGLGHITGKKLWPAVNQARLRKSLIADSGWSEDEVCNAVGVSKRELRSKLKTLTLCDLYRASDYGDQFTPEKYNLFREIIRSRDVSRFIGWSDADNRPDNQANVDRLFSWLSREDATPTDDDSKSPPDFTYLDMLFRSDAYKDADVVYIKPELQTYSTFDFANVELFIDEGYRAARAAFSSHRWVRPRARPGNL